MPDSLHDLTIPAPIDRVFSLLTTDAGLRAWWTGDTTASPELGHVNVFRFGPDVAMHFRVDEHEPPRRLRWTCVPGPGSPPEWLGTEIVADLSSDNGGARLRFAHAGWRSLEGGFALCNSTWGDLMHRLSEAAQGRPRGPRFSARPVLIAQRYLRAWIAGRFDEVERLLAPAVRFTGPIDRFARRAELIAALQKLQTIVERAELVGSIAEGDEVALRYDLHTRVSTIGVTRVAEHFIVKEGVITEIELFFDSAPYWELFR